MIEIQLLLVRIQFYIDNWVTCCTELLITLSFYQAYAIYNRHLIITNIDVFLHILFQIFTCRPTDSSDGVTPDVIVDYLHNYPKAVVAYLKYLVFEQKLQVGELQGLHFGCYMLAKL